MTSGDERELVRRGCGGRRAGCVPEGGCLEATEQDFVPEGGGGHALFWARRQALE